MTKEKETPQAQEVEAEVIDTDLSPVSRADRWLAETRETVAEKAAQYRPPESIEDERAYKDAKQARAMCRRDAAELDAQRKAMTRSVEDFLKTFRSQVKDVLAPLTDLDDEYKAVIGEYERLWTERRRAYLGEAYEDFAPDLVPLVPFDRLYEEYGRERGRDWLARGTNSEAAKESIYKAVDQIAQDERTIDALDMTDEERRALKADYFRSLSMQQALNRAGERREQRERVEALEAERRAREEEEARARAEAEAYDEHAAADDNPVPEEPGAVQAARRAAAAVGAPQPRPMDTHSVMTPREIEEYNAGLAGGTMPQPVAQPVAAAQPAAATWVFAGYGNEAQARAFGEWCSRAGVSRHKEIPTNGRSYVLHAQRRG